MKKSRKKKHAAPVSIADHERKRVDRISASRPVFTRVVQKKILMSLNAQRDRARFAKNFKQMRRIDRLILQVRLMTCTENWYENICRTGENYPLPGMVLCRAEVRIADTTLKGRRWTPKDCADWEDQSDLFGKVRYPSSIGSVVTMASLRKGYKHDFDLD